MIIKDFLSKQQLQEQKIKMQRLNKDTENIYASVISNNMHYLVKIFIEYFGDVIIKSIDTALLTNFLFKETANIRTKLYHEIQKSLHKEYHDSEFLLHGNIKRLSTVYIDNYCKSIKHLITSLIEEFSITKTSDKLDNHEIIKNIIKKQLALHDFLFYIQHNFTDINIIQNEIERNQEELEIFKESYEFIIFLS